MKTKDAQTIKKWEKKLPKGKLLEKDDDLLESAARGCIDSKKGRFVSDAEIKKMLKD